MKGRGLASSPFNSLVFAETYAMMYKIHTIIVERDTDFSSCGVEEWQWIIRYNQLQISKTNKNQDIILNER